MFRSGLRSTLVLAGLSVLASGMAEARDIRVVRKTLEPVETVAQATPAAPIIRDVTPEKLKATIEPAAATPSCARKVKVIYAGYGEANRAEPCPSAAGMTATAPTAVATR